MSIQGVGPVHNNQQNPPNVAGINLKPVENSHHLKVKAIATGILSAVALSAAVIIGGCFISLMSVGAPFLALASLIGAVALGVLGRDLFVTSLNFEDMSAGFTLKQQTPGIPNHFNDTWLLGQLYKDGRNLKNEISKAFR